MFPKFPIQMCYASATKTSQIEYSDANEDLSERFVIRGDENIQKAQNDGYPKKSRKKQVWFSTDHEYKIKIILSTPIFLWSLMCPAVD